MNIKELNQWTKNTAAISKNRSVFHMEPSQITTLKAGDIIPIMYFEVMPGSSIKGNLTYLLRMLTPAEPVMDQAVIDFYCFYESYASLTKAYKNLIVNENGNNADWEQFCGENKSGYWESEHTYKLNKLNTHFVDNDEEGTIYPQSVINYLGIPANNYEGSYIKTTNTITGETNEKLSMTNNNPKINILAPALLDHIYNEWFRNEVVEAPTEWIQKGEIANLYKDGLTDGWQNSEYPYKANIIGLLQNTLPEPQQGEEFTFNLGIEAPIQAEVPSLKFKWQTTTGQDITGTEDLNSTSSPTISVAANGHIGGGIREVVGATEGTNITGTADLTGATGLTIKDLRNAIAIQHMQEKFARSGNRYREFLQAFYGVKPSNRALLIPEYLGGQRDPINIQQVVTVAQTSEADLGELGAYSHTAGYINTFFNKSFEEWGMVMIVAVIRTIKKEVFGINKHLTKETLEDYVIPDLEAIGDQAIYKKELDIFHDGTDEIFGYEERYKEFKTIPDTITGYVNPTSGDEILSRYTYQTEFEDTPYLDTNYMKQDFNKVGKTLINTKTLSQFLLNTALDITYTAPMKVYAIPGLDKI